MTSQRPDHPPLFDDAVTYASEKERQRHEAFERQRIADRRVMLDGFRLWRFCPAKSCTRARGCRGETMRCVRERFHKLVPEDARDWYFHVVACLCAGHDYGDAVRRADATVARRRAARAEFARRYPGIGVSG